MDIEAYEDHSVRDARKVRRGLTGDEQILHSRGRFVVEAPDVTAA